jgi:hypothetical protein
MPVAGVAACVRVVVRSVALASAKGPSTLRAPELLAECAFRRSA